MHFDPRAFLDGVAEFVFTAGLSLTLLTGAVFGGEALGRVVGRIGGSR